ncbi:carboxymuconolactone decarboxylase family protein [Snodgrassella communis]|uniref:carboxymuconolactone decarboxylase family protein n=1 Tax=Snodgrassella communis TaxID=2946699 RepID=UPI0021495EC0|nr:carboxymuconolactone decarboxylase family protein [Snodgrassella communis]
MVTRAAITSTSAQHDYYAALISAGNFEQLSAHLSIGKQNGISQSEIVEIITHLAFYVGWPKAWSAFSLAKEIYNSSEK